MGYREDKTEEKIVGFQSEPPFREDFSAEAEE
jgi:hypothetical protein